MKAGYSLELAQTQKLVLTPELRQAIAILQMNTQELATLIRQQVEENPLLEILEEPPEELPGEREKDELEEWAEYLGFNEPVFEAREERTFPSYETYTPSEITLRDHLAVQLGLSDLSPQERVVGEYIIGNIDHNGYLRAGLEELALATGVGIEMVEKVLRVVQTFDPPGVGARDLRECLELQLDAMGIHDEVVRAIVRYHLEDLAAGRRQKIARQLKVPLEEVDRAKEIISGLDPKPGARISGGQITYIRPDITVRKVGSDFVVILNDQDLPRVFWNPVYRRLLNYRNCPETHAFLKRKFKEALNLLRSIEQRRRTVIRVMETIVRHQREFFERGFGQMKPMTLKDVADELGIHQSTVSRAVSGKYVDTPFGVVPVKVFFANKVNSDAPVSSDSVKRMIQALVKEEDPRKPLSDMEIAEKLKTKGIKVSRRTVAKYREMLGIPSSARRRKHE
ncbi:MAG: RNA polymerase factor sigma-54 [Firmicutes bacterium]|nr:RNA polymerase factor sigma-54 [Candidatus Fermentithermobacillaceae bacterium]